MPTYPTRIHGHSAFSARRTRAKTVLDMRDSPPIADRAICTKNTGREREERGVDVAAGKGFTSQNECRPSRYLGGHVDVEAHEINSTRVGTDVDIGAAPVAAEAHAEAAEDDAPVGAVHRGGGRVRIVGAGKGRKVELQQG